MKDIYWKGHTILLLISLLCCFPDFVYAYSLRQFSNKNGLSNSAIQSLYQDSQGVLWIGTCDGLNVFDGNNIHLYIRPLMCHATYCQATLSARS